MAKVEGDALWRVLEEHVRSHGCKQAFNFGAYEVIARQQAIYLAGIRQNKQLLEELLQVAPQGELRMSQLKEAFMKLAQQYRELMSGSMLTLDLWSGARSDKVTTMLAHVRRYCNDHTKQNNNHSKATKEDVECIKHLCSLIVAKPSAFVSSSRTSSCSPSCSRKLEREVSEISVDEEGFPKMLTMGGAGFETKAASGKGPLKKKAKEVDLAALAVSDMLLAEAMQMLGEGPPPLVATKSAPKAGALASRCWAFQGCRGHCQASRCC